MSAYGDGQLPRPRGRGTGCIVHLPPSSISCEGGTIFVMCDQCVEN